LLQFSVLHHFLNVSFELKLLEDILGYLFYNALAQQSLQLIF